jgi:hypothetical protein
MNERGKRESEYSERYSTFNGGNTFTVMKVPRQCQLVLVKVG